MSFVIVTPDLVTAAASDLSNIGRAIGQANAAASAPTTELLAAGADEVSTAVAELFGAHARVYQRLSADAAAFHSRFAELMSTAAGQYASAEAAAASPLQQVLTRSTRPPSRCSGAR